MIFCFALPLWILFMYLINVQVPAIYWFKRSFSEENFSSSHFHGPMLTAWYLEAFRGVSLQCLWLWELMQCYAMGAVLADLGLWVCMTAPEHPSCLIQLALHPLVNKSLCGHGIWGPWGGGGPTLQAWSDLHWGKVALCVCARCESQLWGSFSLLLN